MKFIKCLRKHNYDDRVGVFIYTSNTPNFYTVRDLIENKPDFKPDLLNYRVCFINATNMTINSKQVPVVVYHLGI